MKGIQLATSTIILIILGLIILISIAMMLGTSKAQIDIVAVREALRSCCGDRSIYNCNDNPSSVSCRVPWRQQSMTLEELRIEANVTDLNSFCFCPAS
jgi:hypothetical protein